MLKCVCAGRLPRGDSGRTEDPLPSSFAAMLIHTIVVDPWLVDDMHTFSV